MNTSTQSKSTKASAVDQIQGRLSDKILAGGFFQQDIPTSNTGIILMVIGGIAGAIIVFVLAVLVGAGTANNMGMVWLGMGGVVGAVTSQSIYKSIIAKSDQKKGDLPKQIFLAIGEDKVYVFEWQAGWSSLNIKNQVAIWSRKEITARPSTSRDPVLGEQLTVVIQVPNINKPIVILQSAGDDEKQTVEMLMSEKK